MTQMRSAPEKNRLPKLTKPTFLSVLAVDKTPEPPAISSLQRFEAAGQPTALIVAKILRTSFPDAQRVVDLTPGGGCFWRADVPLTVSVEASSHDFCRLPYERDSYDVALFDPPHNADAGARSIMGQRYGTYRQAELEPAVRQGAREAWRVARLGVIVKVTDAIHAQRFVRMSGWIYGELGEPYEVVHQEHRPLIDSRSCPRATTAVAT
jgi:hypothetical protein